MRVLFAEDDKRLGNLIKRLLEKRQIKVDWVECGDAALEHAVYAAYDVIILDWMLPGKSGLEVCSQLRKQGCQSSILMLTAKDTVEDKVLGLNSGADDYLVKPFEFVELLARIRALSRRGLIPFQDEFVQFGDLTLNRSARILKKREEEIQLTGREFQLLDMLIRNKGQVLTREVLLDRVWGLEADVSQNNLDAFIRLLRKKIEAEDFPVIIKNVRGIGYRLEVLDV